MKQIIRVNSGETDGNEQGNEWRVHYVLYSTSDNDGNDCFDLYDDDGAGNGAMIARGYSRNAMQSLTLRLGSFVEWEQVRAA